MSTSRFVTRRLALFRQTKCVVLLPMRVVAMRFIHEVVDLHHVFWRDDTASTESSISDNHPITDYSFSTVVWPTCIQLIERSNCSTRRRVMNELSKLSPMLPCRMLQSDTVVHSSVRGRLDPDAERFRRYGERPPLSSMTGISGIIEISALHVVMPIITKIAVL